MRRCLQTTRKIFGNHKDNPKVIVLPLLKELSIGTCDIPDDINKIQSEFPEYDFSLLDMYLVRGLWFIDILENEEQKKTLLDKLYRDYKDVEDMVKHAPRLMTQEMLDDFPEYYEKLVDFNERVSRAKIWMKEELKDIPYAESVVVVAHSFVLQTFISEEYGAAGQYIGSRKFLNGEVFEYLL